MGEFPKLMKTEEIEVSPRELQNMIMAGDPRVSVIRLRKEIRARDSTIKLLRKINVENKKMALKNKRKLDVDKGIVDNVIAYPILKQFIKDQGMSDNLFCLFVVISSYEWIGIKELAYITGFAEVPIRNWLKRLIDGGYVERFRATRVNYCLSVKGRDYFNEFQSLYATKLSEVVDQYNKLYQNAKIKSVKKVIALKKVLRKK